MEIKEIIRRWQAKEGPGQIAFGTGLSRNTVRKYLGAAQAEGIAQGGPAPTEDQLSRLATMLHRVISGNMADMRKMRLPLPVARVDKRILQTA